MGVSDGLLCGWFVYETFAYSSTVWQVVGGPPRQHRHVEMYMYQGDSTLKGR